MRALKIATIVMGVMIVVGTAVLGVLLARRVSGAPGGPAFIAGILEEPSDTRIAGVAAVQDRLAVQLQGGGPDRVLLLDPRTGARLGLITLGPPVPGAERR